MKLNNIFKKQSIQLWMLMRMEEMLESSQAAISSNLLKVPVPSDYYDEKAPTEIQDLINMGFKSSLEVRNYQEELKNRKRLYLEEYDRVKKHNDQITSANDEIARMKERLQFLLKARKVYGEDTILIPFSAFTTLLKKYNLRCGTFENFIGEIPKDRVQDLKNLLGVKNHPKGVIELLPVVKLEHSSASTEYYHVKRKLKKFPFLRDYHHYTGSMWFRSNNNDEYTYTFPDGEVLTQKGRDVSYKIITAAYDSTKFFIAAPKKYFKESFSTEKIKNPPRDKDPLVCALTEHGVLVTVRWGEEASDRIIRAFEGFNEKLKSVGL